MGNKQCTTSVFQDEEEEETWFEWMETTGDRRNQKQLSISPRTELLPVQPANFQPDVTYRSENKKHKVSSEDETLKGLHLARSKHASHSFRGDLKENNNLPRIKEEARPNNLEMVAGEVSDVKEVGIKFNRIYIIQMF